MKVDQELVLIGAVCIAVFIFMFALVMSSNKERIETIKVVETCLTKADTVEKMVVCKDLFKK